MSFRADPMFAGDLRDAAARFAASQPAPQAAWSQARAMGWPALIVSEDHDGAGGSWADVATVIEACAPHGLGLPLVKRCAVVPAMLAAAATPAARATLRQLSRGELDIDVASLDSPLQVQSVAGQTGTWQFSGPLHALNVDHPASHALALAGGRLWLLPSRLWRQPGDARPRGPGAVGAIPSAVHRDLGGQHSVDGTLHNFVCDDAIEIASGPDAQHALQVAQDVGAVMSAVDMVATLGALVEHCIAHLNTRVQFGVALASFQVLRHRVVELYVAYEAASVMLSALLNDASLRSNPTARLNARDAALTKLYVNHLARQGAEVAIQLHGGMGMTVELAASRLAQHLLAAQFDHGARFALLDQLSPARPA